MQHRAMSLTPSQLFAISERSGFTQSTLKKFFKTRRGQAALQRYLRDPSSIHSWYGEIYGAHENPISTTEWAIGGVAVLGIAGLIYYFATKASSSSSTAPTTSSNTLVLAPGAQSGVIPSAGLTIMLPPGASWLSLGTVGSNTSVFLPGSAVASGTATFPPISWKASDGSTQTTTLTLTATT
jgi:hypothetical protein